MEKILVIEDEADVRGSILDLIEAKGYETIAARNGREALDAIKHTVPDLVVSDIMMPEIDGLEVLRQFRSNSVTASVPFIFLTAKTELTDLREGMNSGADDYLMKPFKAKDLLTAIETRLARKKAAEAGINELRSNIAKYVPHELRTPLVALLGFSQMTLDDYYLLSSDEIYDNLERIRIGSKRLHYRIEKFIAFSELETIIQDKIILAELNESVTNNPANIIKSVITSKLKALDRTEDVTLEVEDHCIGIAEVHLRLIVEEAVDNACKFSRQGDKLEIKAARKEDIYEISIYDAGRGMKDEEIRKINAFMQFHRQEMQQEGNGLGLAIIKNVLRIYGGKLNITSQPKEYTRVNLQLNIYPD